MRNSLQTAGFGGPISLDGKRFIDELKVVTKEPTFMKMRISSFFLGAGLACAQSLSAQEAAVTVSPPAVHAQATVAVDPGKLAYGVADVAKLSRAQVSEDVIITYIQNSGNVYNLGPNEIVYLRDQGVTDRVLNTMLDQKRHFAESLAQTPAPNPNPAPAAQQPMDNGTPVTTYAQTAPYVPASTLYTIPYTPTYSYYDSYPYYPYYGYYGYYGPSFAIGFYGHSHYGYGHGGHYGGGHYGGGGIHVGHGGGGGGSHGGGGHSGHH
jgi:uncharacterized membrane protein YgcG